jgi:hypothetical protein
MNGSGYVVFRKNVGNRESTTGQSDRQREIKESKSSGLKERH